MQGPCYFECVGKTVLNCEGLTVFLLRPHLDTEDTICQFSSKRAVRLESAGGILTRGINPLKTKHICFI
jgi:hypothetical protein